MINRKFLMFSMLFCLCAWPLCNSLYGSEDYSWLEEKLKEHEETNRLFSEIKKAYQKRHTDSKSLNELSKQLINKISTKYTNTDAKLVQKIMDKFPKNLRNDILKPLLANRFIKKIRPILNFQKSDNLNKNIIYKVLKLNENTFVTYDANEKNEKFLKVWDTTKKSFKKLKTNTILKHLARLSANKFVTISDDGTIKIWNTKKKECEKTFQEKFKKQHFSQIIGLNNNEFATASYGKNETQMTVKRWNVKTEKHKPFKGKHHPATSFYNLNNHKFISYTDTNGNLIVWNSKTMKNKIFKNTNLKEQKELIITRLNDHSFITKDDDYNLKTWNTKTSNVSKEIKTDFQYISRLNEKKIVGISNNQIKILNLENKNITTHDSLHISPKEEPQEIIGLNENQFILHSINKGSKDKHIDELYIYTLNELPAITFNGLALCIALQAKYEKSGKKTTITSKDLNLNHEWLWFPKDLKTRIINAGWVKK